MVLAVDKKALALLAVIVLAATGIAAFYFLNQPPVPGKTFGAEFTEMASVWKKAGIKAERFHEAFDEIDALDGETLALLGGELEEFGENAENPASRELAAAYSMLAGVGLASKKLAAAEEELADVGFTLEEECANRDKIAAYAGAMEELLLALKEYSAKSNYVIANYPNEAAAVLLEEMPESFEEEELVLDELKYAVSALESEC